MQNLIRDLNHLYRNQTALHQLDCEANGFEWLVGDDADNSVFAWLRRDNAGNTVMVISNFTPVPRVDYRIGVAEELQHWREVLNTDSPHYGGGNVGNGDSPVSIEAIAANGQSHSIKLSLPPLATVFMLHVK